ncbi:FAD-binding oxidoreductase [Vineibacter terrae]|uniref:FAD-binding oxidoreductase n=1 Tax=Vineibacter terrae TaxID=2586908 RepID=UPI002E3103E4|nr:FAD-binding oxidoreductase [Vineibacter terrae]HEX2887079.1 FAD-binding oxidoreductase [Vineibacter terrae]
MPDTYTSVPNAVPTAVLDAIHRAVGDKGFVVDEHEMEPHVVEWRDNYRGRAAAVVRPASTEEVAAVVRICAEAGVPIVPQGGMTGLVGAGIPHEHGGEIVLSLRRMNRILEVNPTAYTMTVEAGAVLKAIQDEAAAHDRLFPLSLAAEGSCTIGGNLSTNAGGVQVLHYGNARSLVLGLEAVLPDGRVWNGLRALKKDNTGYDLKHLFMGAEGTLGVITKAVLKLFPRPKDVATAWLAVRNPAAAVELLSRAHAASEDNVTSCELMGRLGIDLVLSHIPGSVDPLAERHDWYVLLEWSSTRPAPAHGGGMLAKMEAFLGDAMEAGLVFDAVLAQSSAQAQAFWKIRESHSEAQKLEGPSIKHDISVPVHRIPEFVDQGIAAMKAVMPDLRPVPFGHVGDGNLHFNAQSPAGMDKNAFYARRDDINHAVHDLVRSFGGSISAEHGIGRFKLEELERYRGPVELDAMRAIKRALDPRNIMNPGKVVRV